MLHFVLYVSLTVYTMLQGIEKKTTKLQGSEKAVVARHEAGHAVVGTAVANLLSGQPRVEVITLWHSSNNSSISFALASLRPVSLGSTVLEKVELIYVLNHTVNVIAAAVCDMEK